MYWPLGHQRSLLNLKNHISNKDTSKLRTGFVSNQSRQQGTTLLLTMMLHTLNGVLLELTSGKKKDIIILTGEDISK
jgi:hypothetical protein